MPPKKKCPECEIEFEPKKGWQKYCLPKCSNKARAERYWSKRVKKMEQTEN